MSSTTELQAQIGHMEDAFGAGNYHMHTATRLPGQTGARLQAEQVLANVAAHVGDRATLQAWAHNAELARQLANSPVRVGEGIAPILPNQLAGPWSAEDLARASVGESPLKNRSAGLRDG